VNKQIIPDEGVAIGAAIQAAIENNVEDERLERLVLLDIIPLSLGVGVNDDIMRVIIPKNTTIPCKETEEYFTTVDNQESMEVKIVEGERKFCSDNHLLGNFTLPLTTRGPKGTVKVSITFEVDLNGFLHVTVVQKGQGGNNNTIEIHILEDAKKYESYNLKIMDFALKIKKQYPNNNNAVNKADKIIKWIKQNPEFQLDAEIYNSKYDELQKLI